ncbi:MAG: MBL fold metallo-hydrolase [Defluviitaleaceae bacterium]|nr:MBL fold metallo-hydrolase [Defluviitaleaceae bacterium]
MVNGIYAIKTKNANFFIVKNDDEYIAIDAGYDEKIVKAELGKMNIDPEKVTTVLLTHTDFDHIGALRVFKNADIYISKQEVQMIDGTTVRILGFAKNRLTHNYTTVEDGEELRFGKIKIKGILTPGHTNGSMSYVLDDKYLFVGDTLRLENGRAKVFNSLFNMDDDVQKESIMKLSKIQDIEYIFTAHYGFTNNYEEVFKDFVL